MKIMNDDDHKKTTKEKQTSLYMHLLIHLGLLDKNYKHKYTGIRSRGSDFRVLAQISEPKSESQRYNYGKTKHSAFKRSLNVGIAYDFLIFLRGKGPFEMTL